jgi:hypothetical protein
MYAFVYRSGVIKIAPRCPRGDTALPLAKGPRKVLHNAIAGCARKSYTKGIWLVPGVPEAQSDAAALKAVEAFREWLDKRLPPENCSRFVLVGEGV